MNDSILIRILQIVSAISTLLMILFGAKMHSSGVQVDSLTALTDQYRYAIGKQHSHELGLREELDALCARRHEDHG